MRLGPPHPALAGLACAAVALAVIPPTTAAWTDSATVSTSGTGISALDVLEPVLSCSTGLGTATVSWPVATNPTTPTYTVTVGGVARTPTTSGGVMSVTVSVALLTALFGTLTGGGSKVVAVTAGLPGTTWTSQTVTRTVNYTVLAVTCAPA